MSITYANITIAKSHTARKKRKARCLVDTGVTLTVLPGKLLRALGIRPHDEEEFGLADGSVITRKVGRAFIEYSGRGEYTLVVFGEEGDSNLLGALTLENLRLWLDPFRRELHPLKMYLKKVVV